MTPDERWPDDFLEGLRAEADPLADDTVAALFAQGEVEAVNKLFGQLICNDDPLTADLPPEARAYFEATEKLPEWADPALIERGEKVFMQYGVLGLVGLLGGALPECYALAKGVKVLCLTQKLTAHTRRRLYETAQMVVDVMAPGGLGPKGRGIRAAQKVRLMHATIRHLLLLPPTEADHTLRDVKSFAAVLGQQQWDPALGTPINQEDMAFTLLTFDSVIRRVWATLGAELSPEDVNAYHHCWKVVGYVMGVRDDLLMDNPDDADAFFRRIREHQQGASDEGRLLTRALMDTITDVLDLPLGGRLAPVLLLRTVLSPQTANLLGVPELPRVVLWVSAPVFWTLNLVIDARDALARDIPGFDCIVQWFGRRWVERLTRINRGWERKLFRLPEHLATAWRVPQAGA
jgi:hypothetical protein